MYLRSLRGSRPQRLGFSSLYRCEALQALLSPVFFGVLVVPSIALMEL